MNKEIQMTEYEYNAKVMGTDLSIAIVTNSKELSNSIYAENLKKIQNYEKRFSRFLSESELSQLNKAKNMVVSPVFMEVFLKANELFLETDGFFNPLVQIERFGYNKTFAEIEKTETCGDERNVENKRNNESEKNYNIDFSSIVIDQNLSKITLEAGQKLDFGGFLKGYLAEKIAKEIKANFEKIDSKKFGGVIVNLGGDIHTQGLDANKQKFVFNIYNPVTAKDEIAVTLYNESLATSGTYKRLWQNSGETIHHILDKSGTKNPTSNIISASVINSDGGKADAYTKIFISLESELALEKLQKKNDNKIKFIIIKNNGEIVKKID
jgi:thiamine biosynthesis lipoprotein